MIWWLKTKGVLAVSAAGLITLLAALVIRQEAIPVPSVMGASGQLLVVQILGLVPALLLLHGLVRGDATAEAVGLRSAPKRNIALCLGFSIILIALAGLVHAIWDSPEALSMARNTLGYLGTALIVRMLLGPGIAAMAVAALPLVCAATGRRPSGGARPWAWPLHPAESGIAAAEVTLLLLVGCVTLCRRQPSILDPLSNTT